MISVLWEFLNEMFWSAAFTLSPQSPLEMFYPRLTGEFALLLTAAWSFKPLHWAGDLTGWVTSARRNVLSGRPQQDYQPDAHKAQKPLSWEPAELYFVWRSFLSLSLFFNFYLFFIFLWLVTSFLQKRGRGNAWIDDKTVCDLETELIKSLIITEEGK